MDRSSPARRFRRMAYRALGFALGGAFYLLLIDTLDPPELYAGAGAALLAGLAFEVSREQGFAEARLAPSWVVRAWRPVMRIPADMARLVVAAVVQCVSPARRRGRLRAVPFRTSGDEARDAGRRALAAALGSLAPNTIIVGIDLERELILAHQLVPNGGREAIDILELG